MWQTILTIIAGLVEAISKAADAWNAARQKQAGIDEVTARDAKAEADAARKSEQIAVEGRTDEQTIQSMRDGTF